MWIHENHCLPVPMTEPRKPHGARERGQRAAVAAEHDAEAQRRDLDAERGRARRRLFPAPAELGLKTRAGAVFSCTGSSPSRAP